MRVISGKARSIKLNTIEGESTRPTTDRIKETLFNMISTDVYDSNFLDLFSGSGAIGIEALSRGAQYVCFIDNSSLCTKCIKENLIKTRLIELNNSDIYMQDVLSGLSKLELSQKKFDIIFMDPPYNKDIEKNVLLALDKMNILSEDGYIIVEASLETSFDYIIDTKFEIFKEKLYKSNKHIFIGLK